MRDRVLNQQALGEAAPLEILLFRLLRRGRYRNLAGVGGGLLGRGRWRRRSAAACGDGGTRDGKDDHERRDATIHATLPERAWCGAETHGAANPRVYPDRVNRWRKKWRQPPAASAASDRNA